MSIFTDASKSLGLKTEERPDFRLNLRQANTDKILGIEGTELAKSSKLIARTLYRNVVRGGLVSKNPIAKYTRIREYVKKKDKEKPAPKFYFETHKILKRKRRI